jgi:UDP-N-acetylglucosamine diphosphorylase/glucosamine-1-phosphate N-acetyltransferase
MKVNISDNQKHLEFAPLTHLKPLAKLWVGCLTIEERWKKYLSASEIGYVTEPYLSEKFFSLSDADLTVNANIIPNAELVDFLLNAKSGIILKSGQEIARKGSSSEAIEYSGEILVLNKRWDLYLLNNKVLEADYALLTAHRKSEELSPSNTLIGRPDRLFIEKGAVVEGAILNTKDGPIYISKDSEIMEGSLVRGPFFLGEHAALKMGTKMYGATTIGPYSKIGGEVSNCVVQCFSNKGHDGFIGNALIGEWCNLGADTNSSNLKNNYSTIRTYNYASAGESNHG